MLPASFRQLFREAGYKVQDGALVVGTTPGRSQKIFVEQEQSGLLRLSTSIAGGAAARRAEFSHLACWERNRLSELAGLRIGSRGEVIGECWVPVLGLTPDTLALYVSQLATWADRCEHLIAGEDEF